ncbi:MAG: MFS transporter [Byssovorax sp.]
MSRARPRAAALALLATLGLLYTTQGIPFGLASEYLPVVLRQAGLSRTQIALTFWLQLPWQLKVLWATLADRPSVRPRARLLLLLVQLLLGGTMALYALFDLKTEAPSWFAITALAALFAATQDVFVDALAVRALPPEDRGFGNVAQVAGYRLGMLLGGAGLLLCVGSLGQPLTLLGCAGIVAAAGIGAYLLRDREGAGDAGEAPPSSARPRAAGLFAMLRHALGRETWPVVAMALTFKLGVHVATSIVKPMVVDHGWSPEAIGWAVVSVGTAAGLVGAAIGGLLYRWLGETRALAAAMVLQAVTGVPLLLASLRGCPVLLTTAAIGVEHFASGLGTTVLFAALMTATRASSAGVHYTLLTSVNALAIGLGGLLGGALADRLGEPPTFAIAVVLALAPIALLGRWTAAAVRSGAEPEKDPGVRAG